MGPFPASKSGKRYALLITDGYNGIDDMISAALHQMMPVIDGVDDMITTALCTEINAALPLQFDDALNLLLSDTVLAMAEGERIKSKSKSTNASTSKRNDANAREHADTSDHTDVSNKSAYKTRYARDLPAEPTNYKEAMTSGEKESWQSAMDKELLNLRTRKTFVLCERPKYRKVIGCKWVYMCKEDDKGYVSRYKAQLVAQGFTQVPGVDYTATYAPVVRMATTRLLLHIANTLDWEADQIDITGAYLHSDLEEDLYMEQPPGYSDDKTQVCKLQKTIYGLKQSGRQWHQTLTST
jgi:hypothetical protein